MKIALTDTFLRGFTLKAHWHAVIATGKGKVGAYDKDALARVRFDSEAECREHWAQELGDKIGMVAIKHFDLPQEDIYDALCPGLSIRVTKAGHMGWSFTYDSPRTGQRARLSGKAMGTYPATLLKAARDRAESKRTLVQSNIDPRALDDENPEVPRTVNQLAQKFLGERKGLDTYLEIERFFNVDILPLVGHVVTAEFTLTNYKTVIDAKNGSPSMRKKVAKYLKSLIRYGEGRGGKDRSPIEGADLPDEEGEEEAGDRWLTAAEIIVFITLLPKALRRTRCNALTILMIALVTGQRMNEVCGMAKREIHKVDPETGMERVWIIPKERVKNGYTHKVPLSALAWKLITEAMEKAKGDLLFPADTETGWVATRTVSDALRRNLKTFEFAEAFHAHDLRRTVITHMSLKASGLCVPDKHVSAVMNHQSVLKAGVTNWVYNKNDYLEERRDALDAWGAFLENLISANVVPLKLAA